MNPNLSRPHASPQPRVLLPLLLPLLLGAGALCTTLPIAAGAATKPKRPKAKPPAAAAKAAAPAPAAAPIPAAPKTAAALLTHFRRSPGLQAHFVEAKHMALLAAPLRSEGTLYYRAPGHLARHIEKPGKSVVLIEPDRVRMREGGTWQTINLKTRPVVRRFVGSFVALLRGDAAQLTRLYAMTYTRLPATPPAKPATKPAPKPAPAPKVSRGAASPKNQGFRGWRLRLKPKVAPLNKVVKELVLEGRGLVVRQMRMVELDGDETVTTFSAVNPARRFSAAEVKRFFRPRS